MENFEFKSQTCTTKEQSEKLLKLGLKKETTDCYYINTSYCSEPKWELRFGTPNKLFIKETPNRYIPAWSLHRLIEILYNGTSESIKHLMKLGYKDMNYDTIITCIEDLIKLNQFNKDYLEEKV